MTDSAQRLELAFKPFADFMTGPIFAKLSDETRLSAGSPMARRQLIIGDLRKLAEAVAALRSSALTQSEQAVREALEKARDFIDPDRDPPRLTNREMVAIINSALSRPQEGQR